MNMLQGEMQSFSRKQNLKTWIITEAELVAVDDASVTFYVRCYLLNVNGTRSTRTYSIKTT